MVLCRSMSVLFPGSDFFRLALALIFSLIASLISAMDLSSANPSQVDAFRNAHTLPGDVEEFGKAVRIEASGFMALPESHPEDGS